MQGSDGPWKYQQSIQISPNSTCAMICEHDSAIRSVTRTADLSCHAEGACCHVQVDDSTANLPAVPEWWSDGQLLTQKDGRRRVSEAQEGQQGWEAERRRG